MTQLRKESINFFFREKRYRTPVHFAEVWLRDLGEVEGAPSDHYKSHFEHWRDWFAQERNTPGITTK